MASTSAPAATETRAKRPGERRSDTLAPYQAQGATLGAGSSGRQSTRLQFRTLIVLRWLSLAGQAAGVLITGFVLRLPIPFVSCFALIGVSAWLNVALTVSPAAKRVAKPWEAAWQLSFDIIQLTGLLYTTGGIVNPFCLLLIAPVTLAAATLPLRLVLAPAGPVREAALLWVAQAQRCRDILRRLAETPDTGDAMHERLSLLQFVREVVEPYRGESAVRVEAVVTGPPGMAAPDLWRRPEVLHAMTSIVENAFDFARAEILVMARFVVAPVAVEGRDDGPGFSPEVLARVGEHYDTGRQGAKGRR